MELILNDYHHLWVVAIILFAEYGFVMMAILADLWSGVRRAHRLGEARTSYGLRQTINKSCSYYNVLIILSVMDAMQVAGVFYLDRYYSYSIPIFPIVTFGGALAIAAIEAKSIHENLTDSVKDEFDNVGKMFTEMLKNKDSREKLVEIMNKYMQDGKV